MIRTVLVALLAAQVPGPAQDPPPPRREGRPPRPEGGRGYSIAQATSDRAQLHTIAFDGLAFLTGDFAADTFLPPGKVSDHFGFQYMRDIDAGGLGHSPAFLTRIAHAVLDLLGPAQRARLADLGREQEADTRRLAELRLPLILAFRRNLEGKGGGTLDRAAVVRHSAEIYALDGRLALRRAQVMAGVLASLDARQREALGRMRFGDSRTWPEAPPPPERRQLPHGVQVAVMTYASELFSWQGGGLEADTYFCPERHGMYFGGFGLKSAPAKGRQDYAISTTLTGDQGEAFLALLGPVQARPVTALPDLQRRDLAEIVQVRRAIATELRRFLAGGSADPARVGALARRYGELDGGLSYLYASAFAEVARGLSEAQRRDLARLRAEDPRAPKGPFLYAEPVQLGPVAGWERFFLDGRL